MSYNNFISKEMSIKNQFVETEQDSKVVAIKYSGDSGKVVDEQVDIKAAREKKLDVMRNLIVSEELSHEEKNTSTSMIASNEFAVRVIELDGNRDAALEEVRRIEGLVNGNPQFQAVAHKIYQKMESSAEKHGHPGVISGLMTKNGQVGEQDMGYFVAYVALQELRHSNSPLAKEAELVFTAPSEEAAEHFEALLRSSFTAEQTRNSALITAESKGPEDRSVPKLYVAPAENDQNFFSISFQAMARSYTGNGRVLRWNTGVSATTILRDDELSVLFASAPEQVPAEEQPAPKEPENPAADVPPINPTEPPTPETNEKKADTESGKMLRRLGKIAATITAVALVSKGGSMVKEAIENKQGESSKELSKRLIKWSAMAAYAVPATVIAFKTLNSVKGSIDNADYEQLKKDAWKVALGGMGLYVTRGLVRHFSGVDVFNPDDVTRVARDLGAKFTSKVEKGVKAAEAEEKATAEAPAGEPKSKPKVRILESVRIGLSKTEKSLQVVEDTVDQLKAKIEVVDKIISTLGDGLVIQIPFTDIKLDGSKYLDPVKEVVERVKVVAVGLPKDKQPKDGMRTLGVLGRTDVVVEAVKGRMAELRSVIEAVEAGQNEGPLGFLREILQPFWMTAEEEELMRNAKNAPAAPVEPTTPEETAAPEVELRPAALDDILGLEGLGKVLVNIRDNGANLAELDAFLAANGLRMSAEVFKLLSEGQLKTQLAGLTWDEASQSAVAKA